ncbi:MAG: GFA family protein [Gammaproteobacteria bacterium]|nr:GFA family protein [Gammaproteobacteria bacterium]MDH3467066.1 GFA family protein [Gammaproteobacteria bacterium]
MSKETKAVSGGCYCGKVRYHSRAVDPALVQCHCSQCRKQSGHGYATAMTKSGDVTIEGEENVTWFRASPVAERGFCSSCGSHLFWRSTKDDEMAILAASIDDSSGLKLTSHIFVNDKGDYYDIADGLPQFIDYDNPYTP